MTGITLVCALIALPLVLHADQVIMKDGKIHNGRVMGETSRSVLLRTAPPDSKSIFLSLREVQTIVRESHPPEVPSEEAGRYATLEATMLGTWHEHTVFHFSERPGVGFAGGFRLHPAFELGGGLEWWPSLVGEVSVSDGQTLRGYETFSAWSGGFHAKAFPFYRLADSRWEPYVTAGYRWNRLTPKGSDDYFKGWSWLAGIGTRWRWKKNWAWDGRVVAQDTRYTKIKFQTGEGDLSQVGYTSVTVGLGLVYLFL